MDISKKITEAQELIEASYKNFGNKVYVGNSGGKDSAVILSLVHATIGNNIPVVTNAWVGKDFDDSFNFLLTHPTNKYGFQTFITSPPKSKGLQSIKDIGFKAQIDGTRIDEHDRKDGKSTTFVSNGKDLPRTELKPIVVKGLGGLCMLYPIYNWTDEEVYAYIDEFKLKHLS